MQITDAFLDQGEYFSVEYTKNKIFLHHTAGGNRPDWTIESWNTDRTHSGDIRKVATAFVIGGKSISNGNTAWDGIIFRAFPEKCWAVHLNGSELYTLDKTSIAIELCNYGPLIRNSNGDYYNYVNKKVPATDVVTLDSEFRDYVYYHKYTNAQLDSLRELLLDLAKKYSINLKLGLQEWLKKESLLLPGNLTLLETQKWLNNNGFTGADGEALVEDGIIGQNTKWAMESVNKPAFEYNAQCIKGHEGIWTHANVRKDKTDCSPQPELIDLIKSL